MRVEVNLDGVKKKLSQGSLDRGRYALANQALADMNQFIPFKEAPLRISGTVDSNGKSISYNTPYAARQFYEQATNYTTPGTGPRWDLKASSLYMQDWIDAFVEGADW